MPSRSLPKQCKPQGQMAVMTVSDWWGLLAVPAEQDGGVAVQSRCALRSLVPSRSNQTRLETQTKECSMCVSL